MRNKLAVALIVTIAFAVSDSYAQTGNKWKMYLGYNISAPTGSFKNDFIEKTSFRGAIGEISYAFNPKFSLGLSSGFQDYYQKYPREVYSTGPNEEISAVITNSMQIIPVLAKGTFSPAGSINAAVKPYVSLGAGVNLVNYEQYLGEFPSSNSSAVFAAQAGAGFMVPLSRTNDNTAFKIGANYNYSPYNDNGISNLNTVNFNAGVRFNLK